MPSLLLGTRRCLLQKGTLMSPQVLIDPIMGHTPVMFSNFEVQHLGPQAGREVWIGPAVPHEQEMAEQ